MNDNPLKGSDIRMEIQDCKRGTTWHIWELWFLVLNLLAEYQILKTMRLGPWQVLTINSKSKIATILKLQFFPNHLQQQDKQPGLFLKKIPLEKNTQLSWIFGTTENKELPLEALVSRLEQKIDLIIQL